MHFCKAYDACIFPGAMLLGRFVPNANWSWVRGQIKCNSKDFYHVKYKKKPNKVTSLGSLFPESQTHSTVFTVSCIIFHPGERQVWLLLTHKCFKYCQWNPLIICFELTFVMSIQANDRRQSQQKQNLWHVQYQNLNLSSVLQALQKSSEILWKTMSTFKMHSQLLIWLFLDQFKKRNSLIVGR